MELIESLENELHEAKAARQSRDEQSEELEKLRAELAAKSEAMAKLEADVDEQQRKLSKLRGSESETMRLKAVKEQDQFLIDSLRQENDQLKSALAQAESSAEAPAAAGGNDSAEIRKRDNAIADLQRTIKDRDKEIAKLKESVAGWQKKYEFLSTEAPSAYQSVAEK